MLPQGICGALWRTTGAFFSVRVRPVRVIVHFYDKKELRMNTSVNSFWYRMKHAVRTQHVRIAHALLVVFFVLTTCFASSVALCVRDAVKACPSCAYAATSLALSATTQPSYENPFNGVIEDSGGVRARALGESMAASTVDKQAYFERDTDGHCFVTLRLHQGKEIGDVKFQSSKDDKGAFSEAIAAQTMQKNAKANTIDVRAQVRSQDAALRVSMYVEPMGRYVIYFVKLAQFEPGNAGGFVESVKPGEGSDDTPATAGAAAGAGNSSATQGNGSDTAAQKSASSSESGASATSGVKEFNGDGAPVGSDTKAAANSLNYPLIVGIIVVVIMVIALIVNFAVLAPARARAREAARAACGASTSCEAPVSSNVSGAQTSVPASASTSEHAASAASVPEPCAAPNSVSVQADSNVAQHS